MPGLKRSLSKATTIAGASWLLFGSLYMYGAWTLVPRTIENNRSIQASFVEASGYVQKFQDTHARLPTAPEFEAWASSQPRVPYTVSGVVLLEPPYPSSALAQLGPMPSGSFVLGFPRSGEFEYFAGWSGRSTVPPGSSSYYFLGNFGLDLFAVLTIGAFLLLVGSWLRANNSFKPNPLRGSA